MASNPSPKHAHQPRCRSCGEGLSTLVVDLGTSPLCQTLVEPEALDRGEAHYPLSVYFCDACNLVQLQEYVSPSEIFSDYPYFSSYSSSWIEHGRQYCADISARLKLDGESRILEVASNDGYLLKHFVDRGFTVLGVEPAENVARVAQEAGVPTESFFFSERSALTLSRRCGKYDLIIGNNVLAHVPDINDFVAGLAVALQPTGTITLEFPHLLNLIERNQFDTIYHEHFSYLSLIALKDIFRRRNFEIYDLDLLDTHGGSLRLYLRHRQLGNTPVAPIVGETIAKELAAGLDQPETYRAFAQRVVGIKRDILQFLIQQRRDGKSVVGYGAPGKGNTLLNYCGIREDMLDYTVDLSEHKHGRYTPGTRIPIYHPDQIKETRPDFLFILPWNLTPEIMAQTAYIRDWGGRWVVPIPAIRIYE